VTGRENLKKLDKMGLIYSEGQPPQPATEAKPECAVSPRGLFRFTTAYSKHLCAALVLQTSREFAFV